MVMGGCVWHANTFTFSVFDMCCWMHAWVVCVCVCVVGVHVEEL